MTIRTLTGPKGYKVQLDTSEVFPDDPGQGTPALVIAPSGDTGTYWAVTGEGTIGDNDTPVPHIVSEWLNYIEEYQPVI